MHADNMQAHEIHADDMYAHDVHVYKVYTLMRACETPMRRTPRIGSWGDFSTKLRFVGFAPNPSRTKAARQNPGLTV
jgi:hypothetical protein